MNNPIGRSRLERLTHALQENPVAACVMFVAATVLGVLVWINGAAVALDGVCHLLHCVTPWERARVEGQKRVAINNAGVFGSLLGVYLASHALNVSAGISTSAPLPLSNLPELTAARALWRQQEAYFGAQALAYGKSLGLDDAELRSVSWQGIDRFSGFADAPIVALVRQKLDLQYPDSGIGTLFSGNVFWAGCEFLLTDRGRSPMQEGEELAWRVKLSFVFDGHPRCVTPRELDVLAEAMRQGIPQRPRSAPAR